MDTMTTTRIAALIALCAAGAALAGQQAFIPDESNSWAFKTTGDPFAASVIDLRWMNENVAGEKGFVHVSPDGRTLLRGDGEPMRFWATHAAQQEAWTDEQGAAFARFLARQGVNLVRAGAIIKPAPGQDDISKPDMKAVRKIWHTVAAMKKEGIYTMVSPIWLHDGFEQDPGIEGYGPKEALYNVIFVEPKLQDAYKAWVRELYVTTNPYTGVALKDDPSVIAIEAFNEDTMLFWTFQRLKGGPLRTLEQRFAAWATNRYGSLDAALKAWGGYKADGDNPAAGRLGMLTWYFATPEGRKLAISARRMSDQLRFIAGLQYAFHADMKKHLRETLGCKQLFTTSNFHAMDKTMEDLENWTKTAGDIVCANTYVGGMHKGSNTGWRVDPGDIFDSVSCTREPLRLPMLKKQVGNRPYWVTETLWVNPHEYQNEAALLTAIYNGVSDVNAVFFAGPRDVTWAGNMYYAFTPDDGHGKAMMKWNCSEPGHMGSFAAAALIHRLGYAATPDPVVVERRTFDDMVGMKPSMIAEGGEYDPNRYAGGAMKGAEGGTVPQEAFLTGPVLVDFDPASQTKVAPVAHAAATNRPVVSANGIVAADPAKGLVTLDSPRAQAAIGFLKSAGTVKLSSCTIVCDAGHAGIALVTLDGKPLKTADRILVQIAPRARPTGWKIEPIGDAAAGAGGEEWKIVNTGRLPFRVERLSGKVTLSNAVIAKAEKLNENGEPSGPVPLRKKDGTVSLDLPGDALYVLLSQ